MSRQSPNGTYWKKRALRAEADIAAIVQTVKQSALDGTWEPYFRAGMLFTCEKIAEALGEHSAAQDEK